jgi:hypothetical protein
MSRLACATARGLTEYDALVGTPLKSCPEVGAAAVGAPNASIC